MFDIIYYAIIGLNVGGAALWVYRNWRRDRPSWRRNVSQ